MLNSSRSASAVIAKRNRGFTMLELVVVMILIALIAGAVSISFSRSFASSKVRAAGRDMVAAMRYTRGQAIVHRAEQAFTVDVDKRQYSAANKPPVQLPEKMDMKLLTAEHELTGEKVGAIRFYPDGSSSGGRVTLNVGRHEWRIEVAWLTGEIHMNEIKQ